MNISKNQHKKNRVRRQRSKKAAGAARKAERKAQRLAGSA